MNMRTLFSFYIHIYIGTIFYESSGSHTNNFTIYYAYTKIEWHFQQRNLLKRISKKNISIVVVVAVIIAWTSSIRQL